MWRIRTLIFMLFFIIGCTSSNKDGNEMAMDGFWQEDFGQFPDQPFMQLEWETTQTESYLKEKGFTLINHTNSIHYFNAETKTEVILPEAPKLNNFKVFKKGEEAWEMKEELLQVMDNHAMLIEGNESFKVYEVKTSTHHYWVKITFFDKTIKLAFDLVTAH